MAGPQFGELKRVDLRELWPKEATNFTPWLAENIGRLGEALGMDLELVQREAPVGDYSLDLLAKDIGRNCPVVIENQLNPTDHIHLGQLLTYAAGLDAPIVIWVCSEVREEHRLALDWLNQHTDEETEFYAVAIEALQIDGSKPAFNFRPVVFPNDWRKNSIRATSDGPLSSRSVAYLAFFQNLMDELREKHKFTGARKAQPTNWCSYSSGIRGIVYSFSFNQGGRVRAEIYIDTGDRGRNKTIFDSALAMKDPLEAEFGCPLAWERLDEKQACRIAVYREGSIEESSKLDEIRQWAVDQLLKLKKVLGPKMKKAVEAAPL